MKSTYYKVSEDLKIKIVRNLAKYYKVSLIINLILVVVILILLLKPNTVIIKHKHTTDTIRVGDVGLTDSNIAAELLKNQCILPAVAVAQARIETGNYKSQVCTQNKNLFGIKFHKCQYVAGTHLNHARYKSFRDNIKCYIHIQNRYLRNIDGKYATAPNYIPILKSIQK